MASARSKVVVSWSSGKDSAYTLHRLRLQPQFEVVGLLTTVTRDFDRVSMHGVREELLRQQAAAAGLPLRIVEIPSPCPNEVYEERMRAEVAHLRDEGVSHVAFGDLFLADVRAYRETRLAGSGLAPLFPLWGSATSELAREMIRSGLRTRVVVIDPQKLPREFAGREFDEEFLRELPPSVDPCGENGEFHTFVTAGPMFSHPLSVSVGPTVERDGFVFTDLKPA